MKANDMLNALIFGGGGSSTINDMSTSGGESDSGKVLAVNSNGKITPVNLTVGEGTVAVDSTLAVAGAAADAKKTGDEIATLNESLGNKVGVSDKNVVTYDMIHKAEPSQITANRIVDFWFYNNSKRTDGKSVEFTPELNVLYVFDYDKTKTQSYTIGNITFVTDADDVAHTGSNYAHMTRHVDEENSKIYIIFWAEGKLYLTNVFSGITYYSLDTVLVEADQESSVDFLKEGWEPSIMNVSRVGFTQKVITHKWYSQKGVLQSFDYAFSVPSYDIHAVGWYKAPNRVVLLDDEWNFVESKPSGFFYNDGSYYFAQPHDGSTSFSVEFIGHGIASFGGEGVISIGDQQNINKPIGKVIVCFGDSITSTGYPSKLSDITHCVTLNYGGSGNSSAKIRKVVTGIGSENSTPFDWSKNPDIAIIMTGWNDGAYPGTLEGDIPSTTIDDADGDWTAYLAQFNASHSQNTTYGNLAFMIEWIQANHPEVRILLANYHNSTFYEGRTDRIDRIVKDLSELYGVEMIDVRRTCGINEKNKSTYLTDGLHPNDAGQELIAKAILRGM